MQYLYGFLGASHSVEPGLPYNETEIPKPDDFLPSSPSDGNSEIDAVIHNTLERFRSASTNVKTSLLAAWTKPCVLEYLERRLNSSDDKDFPCVIDSLHTVAVHDVQRIREWCFIDSGKSSFLSNLLKRLHSGTLSDGTVTQVTDFLRVLLDSSSRIEPFLTHFYEGGFHEKLAQPLIEASDGRLSPFTVESILDLLAFCVCMHNCTCRSYFLRFGSLLKSLRTILTCSAPFPLSSKNVLLAAIRLVRAFMWQKDSLYLKHMSAFNIPGLIIQLVHLYRPTGFTEGNMIYSAGLEIITFLCVNSQVLVIDSLCKAGSESERLIQMLAEDSDKAHSELALFMLRTIQARKSLYMCSGGEDLMARHSIGSSRGRSLSPHPLVVPLPERKRTVFQNEEDDESYLRSDDEGEIIPRTPGGSPESSSPQNLKRPRFSED